ncbi:dihydrodipicolinate reductase [Actinophytocola oryzae]|uniref:4-hydroxy-tetrahydrodipicolinate reductase n=1 Tax=Actinophytocola oryzae TaxID=502181 RepID=A0A4R7VK31_9PSEU|nr:dihydrodipicolinate reductase [Actinophytocola oryzae]TDV49826.1 4-hydroxy-tetrahydrodipicolinate reductase [Actinophytocola oryzae]
MTCRVVQWATGNIGTHALRAVVRHPDLALAGVYVYAEDKAGQDAGALCGLSPTGVTTTRDVDEIVALGADCVLYMPRLCDLDVVCRLLSSGANVVTTCGEFHHPASMAAEVRDRVVAACAEGGTSVHSTGSSPGFISEALPLVLSSTQRRLDTLTVDEFADLSYRDSPELLFDLMGFGRSSTDLAGRVAHAQAGFGPSLRLVADALGVPLDALRSHGEFATARDTTEIAAGTLRSGTVAAQRITVEGVRADRVLLRFRATWYCTTDLTPAWDVRDTGWQVTVEGDAPLDIAIRFPVPLDTIASVTPGYTANRAVNAVPVVCAAPPGIRTTVDLPQIVAALG